VNNPTLRILAVVSFIVLLFGGMSVYLALQLKEKDEKIEIMTVELEEVKEKLKACE
jgi:hypothetical protein